MALEDRLDFTDVCDALFLAKAIVDKCTVDPERQYYDGEERMPWFNKIKWGGPRPATYGYQEWHNKDYVSVLAVFVMMHGHIKRSQGSYVHCRPGICRLHPWKILSLVGMVASTFAK